jgi:5-methylthioadenosine/S-adenosylhomocysteine deaminase
MEFSAADPEIILINGLMLADPSAPQVEIHRTTVVSANKLTAVNVPSASHDPHALTIDCTDCLIMPGLINCHTHAAMSLLRGLADDLPLDRWLNDYIFPSEARHAGPEFVYLGTKLSAVEMVLGGITTFADGYFHMEHAARATLEVGARAVVAQGILDVPAPDAPLPGSWKARAEQFLSDCPSDSLITPALFCHSPYLCSPETFVAAQRLCSESGALLFSHVAETLWEVGETRTKYGRTPVEHLAQFGILRPGFVAVHAIHLSHAEEDVLAESGATVVHCPESNMKLASGAAPILDLLKRGVSVGIGTDGPASNNNLDLFEEMRSASLMHKLISRDPQAMSARTLVQMATVGGAEVLGMDDRIGSLKVGKLADIVVIDLKRPHLTPLYDPISHLVYAARASDVRDVLVNGKPVVRNGCVLTVDEEELRSQVLAKAQEIGMDFDIKDLGVVGKND